MHVRFWNVGNWQKERRKKADHGIKLFGIEEKVIPNGRKVIPIEVMKKYVEEKG